MDRFYSQDLTFLSLAPECGPYSEVAFPVFNWNPIIEEIFIYKGCYFGWAKTPSPLTDWPLLSLSNAQHYHR